MITYNCRAAKKAQIGSNTNFSCYSCDSRINLRIDLENPTSSESEHAPEVVDDFKRVQRLDEDVTEAKSSQHEGRPRVTEAGRLPGEAKAGQHPPQLQGLKQDGI